MTSIDSCLRLAATVLGLALLAGSSAFAQAAAPPAPPETNQPAVPGALGAVPQADNANDGNFTIKTNVNEVNLIFTVTDKHGRFYP